MQAAWKLSENKMYLAYNQNFIGLIPQPQQKKKRTIVLSRYNLCCECGITIQKKAVGAC